MLGGEKKKQSKNSPKNKKNLDLKIIHHITLIKY